MAGQRDVGIQQAQFQEAPVETYGIARATAGKAVHLLADEGLIRRVPGKGWFVAPKES